MEDEKGQDNLSPESTEHGREGQMPSSNENKEQDLNHTRHEGRVMRPRIQRAERAYMANDADDTQERRFFRPSYNREERGEQHGYTGVQRPYRNYQPRQDYNREGGYVSREGRYPNHEGRYDSRERGFSSRERGYAGRERGYGNRDGGFSSREGRYASPERGYGNRDGGFSNRTSSNGYRQESQYSRNSARYGRDNNYRSREGGSYGNRENGSYGYRSSQGVYGNSRFYGSRLQQHRTDDYDPNAKYSMKKQIEYKELHEDPEAPIRLNRFLSNAGVCSRREADEFITAGVVSVNGTVVTELGTKVKRTDEVKFHDQPVSIERKVYILLNKPKDYVTTSEDPQNRKTVMDLVKDACREHVYPVGRLDRNTTGVLLLTNDGELASKLTHPKYLKKKIYQVTTDKNVTAADMRQIAEGITLEDGEIHVDAIDYASPTDKKQIGIEIHSGKNRIVRRIFEALGYRVMRLDRVLFAGLTKKNVRRGDWRFLTEEEVNMLRMGAFE